MPMLGVHKQRQVDAKRRRACFGRKVLQIMSDLQNLMDDFDLITGIAYELSQQFDGVQTFDRNKKISTYYLAKAVPECMSLLRVLPGSRFTENDDLFDFPTFCSISRNLIEAANLHWYYCIEEIESKHTEFRFILYDFHDYKATIKIGEFLSADESELQALRDNCNDLKIQIKAHSIFNSLLPEVQRQILKGRKCSEFNQTEISEKRGLDIGFFNGVYKLLSNNTHSTPSAISAVVHTRTRGHGMQDAFTCMVLTFVTSFISDMVKTIGDLWGIQFAKEESKEIIQLYSSNLHAAT